MPLPVIDTIFKVTDDGAMYSSYVSQVGVVNVLELAIADDIEVNEELKDGIGSSADGAL